MQPPKRPVALWYEFNDANYSPTLLQILILLLGAVGLVLLLFAIDQLWIKVAILGWAVACAILYALYNAAGRAWHNWRAERRRKGAKREFRFHE